MESGQKMREISIQQQQENRCANVAVDENFQNYLIDYLLTGNLRTAHPFSVWNHWDRTRQWYTWNKISCLPGESKEVNCRKVAPGAPGSWRSGTGRNGSDAGAQIAPVCSAGPGTFVGDH